MSVSDYFSKFCTNLRMETDTINRIQYRYKQITKRINIDYWDSTSEESHSLYVGSYGRGTEIWTSDIDMIVQLPYEIYQKYDSYSSNGQSALLQDVKAVLQKTYSKSHLKGDGQVIGIDFTDESFEIVPVFINKDGSYTYPDTNKGGSWKLTDPRKEISAMNDRNLETNKNLKRLCRMVRAWKGYCDVPMSGILIDTLAYKFINDWKYKDKSYLYYDYMSRDFFEYLKDIDKNKSYWLAPGSSRYVWKKGNFQTKAKTAYNLSLEAIEHESKNRPYSSKKTWRQIYGTKFPN
ncbi:SMODS domain-containing nucleotidyltransferase [Paenibacillus larvae]|uniref:SMODS domain-containing nucleotidyltransferase n=1 Tax=Paenibacillus larvae TaxID=1464 RepID=UPI00227F3E9D|nr:nucleotidyltransferase [Paenibacillus larvae]MCY9747943.1 nucleotidyltransferase [Paenibacillus larvae]MCY9750235.1 nucleotidyltransferase [Paenibacillus larvae]